jgi:hypothetical protein
MQVKWGSYEFTAGACRFGIRCVAELDAAQLPYLYTNEIDVTGRLYGAGDAALGTLETELRAALRKTKQDFGVLRTDGARSASWWRNAETIGGNVVVRGPDFGGTQAAEYALFREFSFSVRNRTPVASVANAVLEFKETVTYDGGEPEYVFKRAINADPQKQLVWQRTEYTVTQSGRAVGYRDYPQPGRQLFPGDRMKAPRVVKESPDREGDRYVRFPITWEYVFAAAAPLVSLPNRWTP